MLDERGLLTDLLTLESFRPAKGSSPVERKAKSLLHFCELLQGALRFLKDHGPQLCHAFFSLALYAPSTAQNKRRLARYDFVELAAPDSPPPLTKDGAQFLAETRQVLRAYSNGKLPPKSSLLA